MKIKSEFTTLQQDERLIIEIGPYMALPITADYEELACQGRRLMIHVDPLQWTVTVFTAPKNELTAGWVIGLIKETP